MSVSYFTGINLNKNQLENARIHVCAGSSAYPQNPSEGQIIYDSEAHILKVYKGSSLRWKDVGTPYTGGDGIDIGSDEIKIAGDAVYNDILALGVDETEEKLVFTKASFTINNNVINSNGGDITIDATQIPVSSGGVTVGVALQGISTDLTSHTTNTSNPHGVTASQLGDGTLGSGVKATTPEQSSNDTSIATTAYVTAKFGSVDALTYKGAIAGGNTGSYGALTSAASKGDVYKVSTAGKINGVPVEAGDMLICNADDTAAATSSNYETIAQKWDVIQGNIDGVVTSVASGTTQGHIAVFNDSTGKVIASGSTSITSVQLTNTAVTHAEDTAVGSATQPVYVNSSGAATATTYSLGASVPATAAFDKYVKSDSITVPNTGNVLTGVTGSGNSLTFTTGSMVTAAAGVTHPTTGTYEGTGSATKGVYVKSDGEVAAMTYSVAKDVPANAVFTDHITTATDSGTGNVVTAVTADASGALTITKGTVQDTATAVTHPESTAVGSATQPIYVNSSGVATATTYALNKTVPSDAVFTDHITTAADSGTGNVVTGVSADANGALTVTKKNIPVVRTASGTLSSSATSLDVSYSGTYLSSYVKDTSNNIVVTAMTVASNKVTFTCAAAPGEALTCVVVYMDPATAYSLS